MYSHLLGKTALITGSTSGIGLAVAKALASKGVNVGINGFGDPKEIEQIRAGIEKEYNVKAYYSGRDLSQRVEVIKLIEDIDQNLGTIQILVNNAGKQHISGIETYDDDIFQQVININLAAQFYAMKYTIPGMKRLDWGRIINVASVHGLVASVDKCGYVASKFGSVGLTKAIALELAKTNITCNALCPGWVMTDLIAHQIQQRADKYNITFEEAKIKILEEKQPSVKAVLPEQIGDLVLFLTSNSASEMRGVALNIDGGWVAQ